MDDLKKYRIKPIGYVYANDEKNALEQFDVDAGDICWDMENVKIHEVVKTISVKRFSQSTLRFTSQELILSSGVRKTFVESNKNSGFPLHNPMEWYLTCDFGLVLQNHDTLEVVGYMLINDFTNKDKGQILSERDALYDKNYLPKGIYIEQIAISPEYQNKDLGGELLNELINIAKNELSVNAIYSHVAVNNKQSLKFHCKHGFIPIGDYLCDDFYGHKDYHSILFELKL